MAVLKRSSKKLFNQAGEITTVIAIVSFVIITVTSLVSSALLSRKQTTTTKAAETCVQMEAHRSGGSPAGVIPNTNKRDVTSACNLGCCQFNDQCPNGQQCNIPNGYCKSGFSCNSSTNKRLGCVNQQCVWQPCSDSCTNQCDDHSDCVSSTSGGGGTSVPPAPPATTGCFYLTAEVYTEKEGTGFKFTPYVKINTVPGANRDGHIQFFVDGGTNDLLGHPYWNGYPGPYVVNPEYNGGSVTTSGQKSRSYRVKIDECNELGNENSLSCTFKVVNGAPQVDNCQCKNCNQYQPAATNPPVPPKAPTNIPPSLPNSGTLPAGSACVSRDIVTCSSSTTSLSCQKCYPDTYSLPGYSCNVIGSKGEGCLAQERCYQCTKNTESTTACWSDMITCENKCGGGAGICELCQEDFSEIRQWQCNPTIAPTTGGVCTTCHGVTPIPTSSTSICSQYNKDSKECLRHECMYYATPCEVCVPKNTTKQEACADQQNLLEDKRIVTVTNNKYESVYVHSIGLRHSTYTIIWRDVKITLTKNSSHTEDFSNEINLQCNDITGNRIYAKVMYENPSNGNVKFTPEVSKNCGGDVILQIPIP